MNVLSLKMPSPSPSSSSVSLAKADSVALSLHNLLGGVARWFAHGSANAVLPMQRTSLRQTQNLHKGCKLEAAHQLVAPYAQNTRPKGLSGRSGLNQVRMIQVRMIQVREPGQARASVGRMVMSGRMADVCAELDRLVAREAALH